MTVNTLSIQDDSLVQIRLVEVQGSGSITVNDRHFVLKAGMVLDITASLHEGLNRLTFVVHTDSLKDDPGRILSRKYEWLGRFEVYVDGKIAGSYFKQGKYWIGGRDHTIETLEINNVRNVSKPTVMYLINQFQRVQGMTDADKSDCPKSHPYLVFNNGVAVHTWKNPIGVDHVFVVDRTEKCVYGGYVGWIHSKQLRNTLQTMQLELQAYLRYD